jgi:hypothetical protein
VLRLTQSIGDGSVSIDSHVQIRLKFLLRLLDQEESNLFGHGISNVSHDDGVVVINPGSQFLHKRLLSIKFGWGLLLLGILRDRVAVLIEFGWSTLARLLFWSSDNARAGLFKVKVVCEEVALLGIDD